MHEGVCLSPSVTHYGHTRSVPSVMVLPRAHRAAFTDVFTCLVLSFKDPLQHAYVQLIAHLNHLRYTKITF